MIHQYKNNGYNIVLDVNSSSVHVVDDIEYDVIGLIEPFINEGIKDADLIKVAVLNCGNFKYPETEMLSAVDKVLEMEKAGRLFAVEPVENYGAEGKEDVKNCKKCFAKFYCSGSCVGNVCEEQVNMSDTDCEQQRGRVEYEIMMKATSAETEGEN